MAAAVGLLGAAGTAAATEPAPFAPDSIWNLPLRDDAPLSPHSDRYVDWLADQVDAGVPWLNTDKCSMPTIRVGADVAGTEVALDGDSYQDPALIAALSDVPIPDSARVADCSDRNIAIIQRQPDGALKQWELWNARRTADGSWVTGWAGVIDDLRTDRGIASTLAWQSENSAFRSTRNWNVTASSVSMTAGVITAEEIEAGEVDHALAMAIPDAAAGRWVWPAQRTDGGLTDPDAIPEGSRLRLDPDLDLDRIAMTPMTRMVAEAAQDYGIVVRDRTDGRTTTFYTEDLDGPALERVRSLLEGRWADHAMREFPWRDLEVLDAPECSSWSQECRLADAAVIDVDTAEPRVGEPVVLDTTNSRLNYPRAEVSWDLDGDGSYESAAGTEVETEFVPESPGRVRIGVRIETTDGTVVTTRREISVSAREQPPVDPVDPEPCPGSACDPSFDLRLSERGRTVVAAIENLDDETLELRVQGVLLRRGSRGPSLGSRRRAIAPAETTVVRLRTAPRGRARKSAALPSRARVRVIGLAGERRTVKTARIALRSR